jgi:hypothetical protein
MTAPRRVSPADAGWSELLADSEAEVDRLITLLVAVREGCCPECVRLFGDSRGVGEGRG